MSREGQQSCGGVWSTSLMGTGVVWSEEEELRGDLITLYSDMKGHCGKVGVDIFPQITAIG